MNAPVAHNGVMAGDGGDSIAERSEKLKAVAHVKIDASDLPAVIERAMMLLDAGDVLRAKRVASGAFDVAKVMERLADSEALIAKAHRLQQDALLIECRAKVLLADEYDRAQASGKAAKGGRRKKDETVPDGNVFAKPFTAEEAGLTRKEVHEARKLRDAEQREPGIAERAIRAMVEAGFSPTRAAVRHRIGTASASAEERGDNLYETPIEAIWSLTGCEEIGGFVLEPFCGRGAISAPLEAMGHSVVISDLRDRGCVTHDGECQHVHDAGQLDLSWLMLVTDDAQKAAIGAAEDGSLAIDIVSNPPYGADMNRLVRHMLEAFLPRKMALLMNLNVLCGSEDEDRTFWMETWPPARVLVHKRRLPMMHRDGWEGDKASSQMNTAWFVWERDDAADFAFQYGSQTIIKRVDWKDFGPDAWVPASGLPVKGGADEPVPATGLPVKGGAESAEVRP